MLLDDEKEEENDLILKDIDCHAIIRPELLFHRRTYLIIDKHFILRNDLEQIQFDNIKLISLNK